MTSLLFLMICGGSVSHATPPPLPPADSTPPKEQVPSAVPVTVSTKADLAVADGQRVTVVGKLSRVTHAGVEGTAIVLGDQTSVFVSQGEPPDGWKWMLGTSVRVQGALWATGAKTEGAWELPTLVDPEAPMPADVGMPGMGF